MPSKNSGLRKEPTLLSALFLDNWKNGVLVNKEHKSKNLAKFTIAAELILALVGTMMLSQTFTTGQIILSVCGMIFAATGLQAAVSDSTSTSLNIVHSNVAALLVSIAILGQINFSTTSGIAFALMAIPFALDAFFGLRQAYANLQETESEYMQVSEPVENASIVPESITSFVDKFEQVFCYQNWKNNVFNKREALNAQMVGGLLILALIYTSIVCAVESSIAPVLSVFVALYASMSIYNYFGLEENSFVNFSTSYFAVSKLALLALAYGSDAILSSGRIDLSYFAMTAVLCFDAFYGLSFYLSQPQFMTEKKTFNSKSNFSATFSMDNWKSNLFRSQNVSLKVGAIIALTLQFTVAMSVVISLTSILAFVALGYTIVGMITFYRQTSEFTQSFHSYFASVVLGALILVSFLFSGFSAETMMLAVAFIGDAVVGLALLKRSITEEIFSGAVDKTSLLNTAVKATYAEDFKFVQSHFQTV